jgi:hypothetical protein
MNKNLYQMFYNWFTPLLFTLGLITPAKATALFLADPLPNILIILTDDQGYHDVSYYGTEDIQTPNIDFFGCRRHAF